MSLRTDISSVGNTQQRKLEDSLVVGSSTHVEPKQQIPIQSLQLHVQILWVKSCADSGVQQALASTAHNNATT